MNKYIETSNKKIPLTTFDKTHNSTKRLKNAGLFLNEHVTIVDFDNDNKNERHIIKYLKEKYPTQIVTTTRGVHFYYSIPEDVTIKNVSDKVTVGGFQVDYKTGKKSFAIVKLNGKDRPGSTNLNLSNLPPLPEICQPLPKAKNITGLEDGDGRNDALFYHLRCVKEHDPYLNRDRVARFINEVCFSTPFEDRELESLLKSAEKAEQSHSAKNIPKFAEFIAYELDVKIYHKEIYFKQDSRHISDDLLLMRATSKHLNLRQNHYKELLQQLYIHSKIVDPYQEFPIRIRNGFIAKAKVVKDDLGFTPFFLDVEYDPDAHDPHVEKFFNEITCGHAELRITLEEILGHCMMTKNFPHKIFFLLGYGRNGKSTFLEMINSFVGRLGSRVSLTGFDDDTSVASLIGKLVNCTDDIDYQKIDKTKYFKSIASGNTVTVRPIYKKPVEFKSTATVIVNANKLPEFSDKSKGLFERLVIVPFKLNLTKETIDNTLDKKLSTDSAKSYVLKLGLEGMGRIVRNRGITDNNFVETALADYRMEHDSMGAYLESNEMRTGIWLKEAYSNYAAFCEHNEITKSSLNSFSKRLKDFGYRKGAQERNPTIKGGSNRDKRIQRI